MMRPGERLAFSLGGRKEVAPAGPPAPSRPTPRTAELTEPARPHDQLSRDVEPAEEPRDWAFLWTLIFTGVLFLRPQDLFPPLEILHLAELSALAGLVSLIVGRLARRQTLTRMTPEFAGVIGLGVIILVTAPFSIWFGGAVTVFTDLYMKVILVYLLAVNVLISPKRIERLTWLLVLSVGYIAFRAVIDYARGENLTARGTRVMGSVGGLMQNPNDMALHMVVFLPFAMFMAMRPGSMAKRLIAAGAGACMLGAIVASGSRGGFIGFAAMVVVLVAFAARQRPMIAVAGIFVVICALPIVPDQYWRRISSINDDSLDDYSSAEARRILFREAYDAFLENPITGVGAGQFKDYNPRGRIQAWHEAHNIWLQVASELGIFGLAVFTFLMARAIGGVWGTRRLLARVRAAARAARRRDGPSHRSAPPVPEISTFEETLFDAHSSAMAAALVGFLACSMFASVAYNWTFYYLLVLAAAPRDIIRQRIPSRAQQRAAAAPVLPDLDQQGVRA
jgi:O-antigen ligase